MRRLLVCTLLSIILGSTAACGDRDEGRPPADGGGEWAGSIDTLASGRILVRNPDTPLWSAAERPRAVELFRLGQLDGPEPDVFGEVRDIELGEAGELIVLDGQAAEIRVFDAEGRHQRSFGRQGQGPGELNRPAGMTLDANGSLWVMNWGNSRYSAFDPLTGESVTERRRLASFTMLPWSGRFDRAGGLIDFGLSTGEQGGNAVILRTDTAFVPVDTLPLPTADERYRISFVQDGTMRMSTFDPFAPRPTFAPTSSGIVVGEGDAVALHRIDFTGDTVMSVMIERSPKPVTDVERDSALAAFEERVEEFGIEPDRRPRVPSVKPAHGAIFVDAEDRIWVRRAAEPNGGAAWDVIDAAGTYLGVVEVPVRPGAVSPVFRDGRLAIVTNVDGVPTVVVYAVAFPADIDG
jgi:hypothetical protein